MEKQQKKENKSNNIKNLSGLITDTAMLQFVPVGINFEKQSFHPAGESIRDGQANDGRGTYLPAY